MGKRSISLSAAWEKELEEAAKKGKRGFSAEIVRRLENEKCWENENRLLTGEDKLDGPSTGVAEVTMVPGEEISGGAEGDLPLVERAIAVEASKALRTEKIDWSDPRYTDGGEISSIEIDDSAKKSTEDFLDGVKTNVTVWPDMGMVLPERNLRDSLKDNPKFNPRNFIATTVEDMDEIKGASGPAPIHESMYSNVLPNKGSEKAKKRPKEAKAGEKPFEMVKGFYREQFSTIQEAESEAVKMGWEAGSYKIDDISGSTK